MEISTGSRIEAADVDEAVVGREMATVSAAGVTMPGVATPPTAIKTTANIMTSSMEPNIRVVLQR